MLTIVSESGGEDDYEGYEDPDYWSDCNGKYNTLKQLEDVKDSLPEHCVDHYIVDVEIAMHEDALQKYKTLVESGYDKKFEVYERFVREQIPEQINNFMASEKVDKYFKCTEKRDGKMVCCKDCHYCLRKGDCIDTKPCKSGVGVFDIKCPRMEFEDKGLDPGTYIPKATFTLTDADGFYKDLLETWGIEKDWITFDKRLMAVANGCQYAPDAKACAEEQNSWFYNYPRSSDKITIFNPKDLTGDSYSTSEELLNRIKTMQVAGSYDGKILYQPKKANRGY